MALDISWTFDRTNSLPINLDELLGDITLTSDAQTIIASTVFLDTWFGALINGYRQIINKNDIRVEVDTIDEPSFLILIRDASTVQISFEQQKLSCNLEDFKFAVKHTIDNFIKDICRELTDIDLAPIQHLVDFSRES